MKHSLYMATTYLKLLRSNAELMTLLEKAFGDRLESLLKDDFIYGEDIENVFQTAKQAGIDCWLLEFGEPISIASHGPLGFAVLSAPDLQTAMTVLADFTMVRSSAYRSEFIHKGKRVAFVSHDQSDNPIIGQWLMESGLYVAQRLIEAIMGHPLGDHGLITFTHAKPAYAKQLEKFYGVRCEYKAESNSISIPKSWCQIASPLSDPISFNSNLQKCRELKLQLTNQADLVEATTLELNRFFDARISGTIPANQLPTLQQLASNNNCSARTFARRLEKQNESYKSLLESSRRHYAVELLQNTHNSVADIAMQLAYQEPANFVRAFKTWFDIPPATWRRRQ